MIKPNAKQGFIRHGPVLIVQHHMASQAQATEPAVAVEDESAPALGVKVAVIGVGLMGPKESAALAVEVAAAGGLYVEAPVLGSQPEAEKGTLLIMVGAEADPREEPQGAVWRLLLCLGQEPNIHFIGPVGTAAAVKLALNQLIASLTVGFSTSLGLVQRSGAPVDKFMSILRASALYAPTYDKKLQKMIDRDYGVANFPTKHLLKDVRLFEAEAAAAGLDTRLLAALQGVVQDTVDRGLGETDYSSVYDAVAFPSKQEE
ncbi:putative 3-hydroxyisobutyrate dehydrogenase, mitochondrial [Tetrabaena socialis]|uniref:Putative 3-hydroxyisobutyrate dehydrogenase, mitochondrial n=1 Tax=Tetrabaena socialis TaxID=47790 RepID=A0A2J8A7P2_9CHLO|nr:putative 3-hydroxyisobutyrate dehydrogenase, mitochondrial [Tetrabaena socialis]|eukprot:PNH08528.1 putative 3-hydroxyisobutyrate dehydrogenase, mitochondrial [Tetrabaena socialis]